ncbi:MAG TPA: alkaline phosphatase family protein [Gaiellaceae bacterium]|nr:alkaline phosphatase family protein [Gaiellaceae bacterium]
MAEDLALARLAQIKHIVVLMMENRSFDHMLGYLKGDGLPEVNGLTGDESNEDGQGKRITVFPFPKEQTAFHLPGKPFDKTLDPQHGPSSVAEQLAGGNGGFVKNFIREKAPPEEFRSLPMGHYTREHLPVYDFLARNYCVCDSWHSSIPGDTWPNRLYALAAKTSESVGHRLRPWERFFRRLGGAGPLHAIENAPIFEVEAFTRQLDEGQWRWYSHDPATLRGADKRYRDFFRPDRKNFAYFNRKEISLPLRAAEASFEFQDSFLDDATKEGEHGLREISWIDPNFVDLRVSDTTSNDDHPPSDIRAGQQLVLELYHALANSPDWADTLLVITYDEHGGFYDHVPPPPVDDGSGFATYGVRVPALVIGPRVRNFVCHELFDHTSLMKTILLRFASDSATAIRRMGLRVERAQHLGVVLDDTPRVGLPGHESLLSELDKWRKDARAARRAAAPGQPAPEPDGAGQDWEPTDLQREFTAFAVAMRDRGLPSGKP